MSEEQSALQFPCYFPIKAMGITSSELDIQIVQIIRRHVPDIQEGAVTSKLSRNGKYTSITVTIRASSKQQLDAIYQDLSDVPEVLVAL